MTKYAPTKLTEAFIAKVQYQDRLTVVRDTKVTGLMLVVNKSCKSYKVQRDLWTGHRGRRRLVKTVRYTLGTTEELSLEEARNQANEMLGQIRRGVDPNAKPTISSQNWTVLKMYEEYGHDLRTRDRVERTFIDMMARLDRYLPKWKEIPINEIKRSFAREEHKRITQNHGPVVANQSLRDFRACYNFALKVADVYQRGQMLVRPVTLEGSSRDGGVNRGAGTTILAEIESKWMVEQLARAANWFKYRGKGELTPTDPKEKYAQHLIAREGNWRPLRAIIHTPTLRQDGSVLQTPGYDPESQLMYLPGGASFPAIPDNPTQQEAQAALQVLAAPFADFPFVSEASRSVILAAVLTGLVRPALRTSPMFCVDAPTAGTGKSLLTEMVGLTILRAYIVAGKPNPMNKIGSFEDWNWVREALVWVGCDDPYKTAQLALEQDPRKTELLELLAAWYARFPKQAVTLAEIDALHEKSWKAGGKQDEKLDYLHRLLIGIGGRPTYNSKSIGKKLRQYVSRVVGGMQLSCRQDPHGSKWSVVKLADIAQRKLPLIGDEV